MCSDGLFPAGASLRCAAGHSFDIARQGYVSLLTGKGSAHRSDTADMVAARNRVFEAGLYAPIVAAVAERCADSRVIVDAGGGPGQYLEAGLTAAGDRAVGIGVDLSKFCARSVARRHPAALSVVADLWAGLPLRDAVADTVLSVFAPRNASEIARVLGSGGRWVVVTPGTGHLAEIVAPMQMLSVGQDKTRRLAEEFGDRFGEVVEQRVQSQVRLSESALTDIAAMGPAAFHRTPEQLAAAAADLASGGPVTATLDVTVTVARRR
ncbi:putative RNA methyltransferase [Gordonia cholesterolivorans]|uniref:putative RNA methyltransferase n=1 Tax=Gordonia cholesterolivorans TaxID=559625 RepID=UPI0031F996C2